MNVLDRPSHNGTTARIESIDLPRTRERRRWVIPVALLLAVALIAASVAFARGRSSAAVTYETTPVVRQDLVQTVTATGTVNPQNTVAVGTQVSGTVSELDADYNSHVRKGQVLAKLDPTTLLAALDQAQAALAQSRAQAESARATASGAQSGIGNAQAVERASQATAQAARSTVAANDAAVASARSNVAKAQSALALAQQTVDRDRSLASQGYIAQSQLDTDASNLVGAQTALQAAQAAVTQARMQAQASASQAAASLAQSAAQGYGASTASSTAQTQAANAVASEAAVGAAEAAVRTAQSNLSKSVIVSPVDGTVVARSVSVGTTVAASFQTPTLFSIAQDLNKMEADLAVGEPDIGNVKAGEGVDFTVLAYPNRTFHGVVSQVRINPTTTSNVVTYTTVVLVNNRGGALLPGMTANASVDVAKAPSALVVPLAALAYQPPAGLAGAGTRTHRHAHPAGTGAATAASGGSPWGATTGSAVAAPAAGSRARLFVQRDGALVRVPVTVVLASGTQAAVTPLRGTLAAGDAVVTTDSSSSASGGTRRPASAGNPLAGGPGGMRGLR